MKNKTVSVPIGMVTRSFYCHQCGERLERWPKTRTLSPGDPDYKKHSRFRHRHMIGDVEVTEFEFRCPACGNTLEYREACLMEKMQKQLHKKVLSPEEILCNKEMAQASMARKARVSTVFFAVVALAFAGLILYFKIKAGDFSFGFYF